MLLYYDVFEGRSLALHMGSISAQLAIQDVFRPKGTTERVEFPLC